MPHYYPVVIPGGKSLAGDSLGFHAYSLRIDNLTNQWLLEETSLAWIPPYSLGVCLRLYGTGVGIILNQAPVGQPQLSPLTGEQTVGVYSDQIRTEVAGSPVRQYSLVQSVSDLTQGAEPALPPVGVTRLWAANNGDLHYVLSNGQDATVISSTNYASYVAGSPIGGDLYGTINNAHIGVRFNDFIGMYAANGTTLVTSFIIDGANNLIQHTPGGTYYWQDTPVTTNLMFLTQTGALTVSASVTAQSGNYFFGTSGTVQMYYVAPFLHASTNFVIDGSQVIFNNNAGYYWGINASNQMHTPNSVVSDGFINAGATIVAFQVGDLGAARGNGSGYCFLGDTNHYIGYTGSYYVLTGSALLVGGAVYLGAIANNDYLLSDGANMLIYAISGSVFTRAAGIFSQNNAGAYVPVYASAFTVSSLRELKRSIEPLDSVESLSQVLDPRSDPVSFYRIDNDNADREIGFIAEDLYKVVPETIAYDDKGKMVGIHYGALTATLWSATRALNERMDRAGLP